MTDPTTIVLVAIPAIISAIGSLIAAIVSIVMVFKILEVHTLVNSQFSQQVQKTADALEKLAKAAPTEGNVKAAQVAAQINEDRVK